MSANTRWVQSITILPPTLTTTTGVWRAVAVVVLSDPAFVEYVTVRSMKKSTVSAEECQRELLKEIGDWIVNPGDYEIDMDEYKVPPGQEDRG